MLHFLGTENHRPEGATSNAGTSIYDDRFYAYIYGGARRSAKSAVPLLMGVASPRTVLDIGCGVGAWLEVWDEQGLDDWVGVDGNTVEADKLKIPTSRFGRYDFVKPFDLGRKFDLVCSFEVAEHLPRTAADTLVDSIITHGDVIAFSAAPPGQGGLRHVNERPYEYWRAKFASRGFKCFDAFRPLVASDKTVDPWYRYNILIFARGVGIERLSEAARQTCIDEYTKVPDVSSIGWRIRRAVLRFLPVRVIDLLAKCYHGTRVTAK